MIEIPVLNVLILLGVKTNISPAHPLKISRIPYPKKKCHFPNPTFQALLLWVFREWKHVNTPANGPEPTLRKGITVILADKNWGNFHILVPSVWIVYKLTCVFSLLPKKNLLKKKKDHKCHSAKTKKKSKSSRDREKFAPKKKERFPSSVAPRQWVKVMKGWFHCKVVSPSWTNSPMLLSWEHWGVDRWILPLDGRRKGYRIGNGCWKCRVFFGYPQVICFWRWWLCHKRQVLVWKCFLF